MIAAICAAGLNMEIGRKGQLLVRIPDDLKRFRRMTKGATVIMGRVTYDSLPKKPLPKRENIIISRRFGAFTELSEHVTGSDLTHVKEFLSVRQQHPEEGDVFIIGGGQIYRELLDCCDRIFLTKVYKSWPDADTFFPEIDSSEDWGIEECSSMMEYEGLSYQFVNYRRKSPGTADR